MTIKRMKSKSLGLAGSMLAWLAACTLPAEPATGQSLTELRDKTLVAWVVPANLDQRGGSVLTLDDTESHFDAIVFGERQPARWMASDTFRRTQLPSA